MWQLSRSYRHSLLFDPSMSALAIIETQKLPKVSARTITMGFVMGDMMTKQLRIQLTLQLEAKLRIQLPWQLKAQLRIQLTLQLESAADTDVAAAQNTAHFAGGSGAQDTKCRLWPRRLWHRELLRLKTRVMTSEVVATRV